MRVIDIKKSSSHELAAKDAALTLLKDGVIVYPTDTLYGLGVNALDELAVEKLFRIKKRPKGKPVPLMVSSLDMAKALAFIDKSREHLLKELWPGEYTFVLWKKKLIPSQISAGKDTVALRIPANSFCQNILRDFEGPITATSANISGESPLSDAESIIERFSKEEECPNLILDAGKLPQANPSAVIDLTTDVPKLLRVNPTSKDKLLKILQLIS
jgi:L-threonylcarbamoyladenylate synthase